MSGQRLCVAGRVARAGRSGKAISLVSPDEYAYLLDLFLFLGRQLNPILKTANAKGTPRFLPKTHLKGCRMEGKGIKIVGSVL